MRESPGGVGNRRVQGGEERGDRRIVRYSAATSDDANAAIVDFRHRLVAGLDRVAQVGEFRAADDLAFREQIGAFGTLLYVGHDWLDRAAMRRSMELMAEEVLPRVNRALGE